MTDRTDNRSGRGGDPRSAAEKAFTKATTKPAELASPAAPAIPLAKETVSLRIAAAVPNRLDRPRLSYEVGEV